MCKRGFIINSACGHHIFYSRATDVWICHKYYERLPYKKDNLEKCEKDIERHVWEDTVPYYNCRACKQYGCWQTHVPSPCDDGPEGWRNELDRALSAPGGNMIALSTFKANIARPNSKSKDEVEVDAAKKSMNKHYQNLSQHSW